jgi:CRISPR-associated exonuclease Cas4
MYSEDDLLPISALQHLAFCERQWGLIHLEQVWEENRLTARGRLMHEQADLSATEARGDLRIARGLRLRSLELGLVGQADVVEFHRLAAGQVPDGVQLEGVSGCWQPFPVEYKHGGPKIGRYDEVQVCAQAMCLEEMLNTTIPTGALFYGRPWRRQDVVFDETLRNETKMLAERLHALTEAGITPQGIFEKKCRNCSLVHICLPQVTSGPKRVDRYLADIIANDINGGASEP